MLGMDFLPLRYLQAMIRPGLLALLLTILLSSLTVSYVAHLNRQAFSLLQDELTRKNKAQEVWGQLLLQHSTLTAHGRIERLARQKMDMDVPDKKRIIMVTP